MVEQMDEQIGKVLHQLQDSGAMDDTLVVYIAGHGDGSAAHRWNQKQVLYEESARVPFIVRPPGGARVPRYEQSQLVSAMLDVIPTICDYAGIQIPDGLDGMTIRPMVNNPDADGGREFVVVETTFGSGTDTDGVEGRMLRTNSHKYVVYNQGKHREQLFDMNSDSGELVDLAKDEVHRDLLHRHRRLLRKWAQQKGDRAGIEMVPEP